MSIPQVSLTTGKVSWTPPTQNTDNSPIAAGEVTGYQVGLRSATAAGSVAGTYPIQSSVTGAATAADALSAISASLKADTYATAVRTISVNGAGPWSAEFVFQGVLPLPLAPTGVSVS